MNNSTTLNGTNSSAVETGVLRPPLVYTAVMAASLILIIIVAVLGNTLVIYAFFSYPRLRHNVTNYFIVSLAVSDILTALFVTTFELDTVVNHQLWSHGEFLCHLWTFMYLLMVPGSVINLLAVTVDRFLVLRIPLRYTTLMTRRRATMAICVLWLYALITALLPTLGWRMDHPKVTHACFFLTTPAYSIFVSVCNFLLPMLFMGFFWTKIYAIAQTHAKRVRKLEQSLSVVENSLSQTDKSSRNSRASISDENATTKKLFENTSATSCKKQFRRHLRGSKYIAILVGAFFLCWFPYTFTSLVASINRDWYINIPSPIMGIFLVMGYLNSALNPLLYPFHDRQFREAFKNIFKRFQQDTFSVISKIKS